MDIHTQLAIESLTLQMETVASVILTLDTKVHALAATSDVSLEGIKLSPEDEEKHEMLLKSMAQRIVKIAFLSAQAEGVEVDEKAIAKNTIDMLQEAIETNGKSMMDGDATTTAIYKDTAVADAADADAQIAEDNADYEIDDEPVVVRRDPMIPMFDTEGTTDGHEEDKENLEPATDDDDLLAVFRSSRKKKVEDPHVEFEDGVIRANFYHPETLPEDPEEFMDYERQAIEYFKYLSAKVEKAGLMDASTARQVGVVLHGGDGFDMEKVTTEEGVITQTVLEQGHSQIYFEVTPKSPVEAAETLIAAYSVSIARLRGAYMQAKLQELQEYVGANQ